MSDQQPKSDEPTSVLPVADETPPETITIITTSTSPSHTPSQLSPVTIRTITPTQSCQKSPLPSPSSSLHPASPSPSPSPQPPQQQHHYQQQQQYQPQEYQQPPVSLSFPTDQSLNISDEVIKEDPLTLRLTDLKIRGSRLPGDNGSSPSIVPDWFNRELFDLGRQVGRNHLSSVLFSHLSGLSMVVHIPSILATLLATGKSRTLGDIFTRYLGTLSHVITWYEGDIWNQNDAAHKSLITVRRMHSNVASRMNPPRSGKNYHSNDHYSNDRQIYLSQYDMALTQFGFIGLIILHPKQVGFPENSQDLVGLIHFWRCVGYLLGLDDRFNILDESDLPGTRALCGRLLESEFKPAINRYPTNQASQMSTAIIQAIKAIIPILSTRGFTKYLYKMTTLEAPVSLDGTAARVGYQGIKVVMRNCLPKPLLTPAINALLKKSILRAQKKSDTIKSRLTNKDDLILEETCFTDV
ncbi:uncharacterized protein LOC107368433 [Tetranychus urticae]|uniref:ER-bound oxygenase mpaB/mpaB'/Rubber oxygenase catalytic domain-containing protein n=1 Tax=Tetranychus urticae TaxID=32264 RepID=T1KXX9_TETUR|nr:uncharacterized protein LOC107368433 [Tetranychus urticae]